MFPGLGRLAGFLTRRRTGGKLEDLERNWKILRKFETGNRRLGL